MVRAEHHGESAPDLVAQRTEVQLGEGRYVVRFDGQPIDSGLIEHGTSKEIKTITLRGHSGPNTGRTIPCIYQLVGDRLRICYGLDGDLPTEFSAATGQQRYLATYRRKSQ